MKTNIDPVVLIAGFYAERHANRPFAPNQDYTGEMLALLGQLHDQAFKDHLFDPGDILKQADRQLFGNDLAVRNYHTVSLRLPPLDRRGSTLTICMGVTDGEPNGTLGIWAEDQKINRRIQRALRHGEQSRHHLLTPWRWVIERLPWMAAVSAHQGDEQ